MHGNCEMHINFGWKAWKEASLKRPRQRWEDIKMDLKQTGMEGVDWIHLAQDSDQWQVTFGHGNEPLGSIQGMLA